MADIDLSAQEAKALFDILTHRETYKEIEDFKYPGAINRYGPPFQANLKSSDSPLLQSLLAKFVLKLPGLRDVSSEFWNNQIQNLVEDLAKAELSESYDKGTVGVRKTLATAIAALIEYPARGSLGGFVREQVDHPNDWDTANPDDVLQAWRACGQELVYGNLLDRLFDKAAETDDLSAHDSVVQCMHEFIIVNLASLMHYTLVLSPEGPTILRLAENVHKLLPYSIVRQTLKIGNVATMLNAMMRVILAKVSVASMTNWIGLSSGADEGMNLMQQIISQVLSWDKREFKKRAEKIEKEKSGPPKAVLDELKSWIQRSRAEHEECRTRSREQGMSMVAVILALSSVSTDLSEPQHAQAAEYLALQLAIRDRQEIIRVLCQRNPDVLSAAVRTAVDAYSPIIRNVHQAVNLSDTVWDFERFVTDLLKMTKPTASQGKGTAPGVEDFVDLLHRHQSSSHKFLHQVAKNGKEVTSWWRQYAHAAAAQFRSDQKPPPSQSVVSEELVTGGIRKGLCAAFAELSVDDREAVRSELKAHYKYIDDLHAASAARIGAVIKRTHSLPFGPGAYLARWQQLMDSTTITPATAEGPVRRGASESVKEEGRKDIDGKPAGFMTEAQAEKAVGESLPSPPDASTTVRLLGDRFRSLLSAG